MTVEEKLAQWLKQPLCGRARTAGVIVVTFSHHPQGGSVIFADQCCTWRYDGAGIYIHTAAGAQVEACMKEAVRIAHHLPRQGARVELGTSRREHSAEVTK